MTASHPFVVLNPRSGGGKVGRYGLVEQARRRGARVLVLDDPAVDVAAGARAAVEAGADLLGVAGGDGTVALVAEVAADLGVPLLVVPAGTRNHFALDLGLDPGRPAAALDALSAGVTRPSDLGMANARPFVNNVSFGAYARIVERPDYREHKIRVVLDALPGLLASPTTFTVRAGDLTVTSPTVALVSNNPYGMRGRPGDAARPRLDRGVLGLICLTVEPPAAPHPPRAAAPRLRRPATMVTAATVVVEAPGTSIVAAVDGEAVTVELPVRCRIRAGVLRVLLPRPPA